MKKYLGLFVLFVGGFYMTSCDDGLLDDFTPGALVAETAIQKSSDLVGLNNSAYNLLIGAQVAEINFNSGFTDESALGFANGGQGQDGDLAWILNGGSDAPNGIWDSHYFVLSYVNRVIKFSENVQAVGSDDAAIAADQAIIDRAVAEALTMRAHCHLQLLTYFSTNPKDLTALGPIISNDVYPASYLGSRSTNADVYALIDADLAQAEAMFTAPGQSTALTPIFANLNFARAVKARAYLTRGDYNNALAAANQVIGAPGLTLATLPQYWGMFHTESNTAEIIFKLKQQNGGARVGGIWASVNTSVSGSPFYEVGRNLFNDLNTTMQPSATALTVTAIASPNITIPGNSLQVGDQIVFNSSLPANATTTNGLVTLPANSILAGKVYYVRSVSGDNITITADVAVATPAIVNVTAANGTNLNLGAMSNANDIRYTTLVHPSSIIDPNYQASTNFLLTDKISFRKYPGTSSLGLLVNDIKMARLSEMYLIRAEALAGNGDLAGAAAAIQTIRNARFNRPQPLPVYASATEAFKDVLLERKKELAAEGFRFIDIKRLAVLAGESGIVRNSKDCEFNGACTLPVTDYRFALPIPQDEYNPNPSILAQQNPGY